MATLVLGLATKGPRPDNPMADLPLKTNLSSRQKKVSDIRTLKIVTFLLVFIFELAALLALLVTGGKNAYRGNINRDCGDGSLGGGIPWSEYLAF